MQTSTTLTGIVKAPQGDELLAKARLIAGEATTNTDAKGNVIFNIQPSADLKGLPHRLPHSQRQKLRIGSTGCPARYSCQVSPSFTGSPCVKLSPYVLLPLFLPAYRNEVRAPFDCTVEIDLLIIDPAQALEIILTPDGLSQRTSIEVRGSPSERTLSASELKNGLGCPKVIL